MKSRENLVRLKQFQVNEKRRQLLQLDMMIAEFERMAVELELQITAEEKKAGITDITTDFYPGGRHEMLNEANRDEVVTNLKNWIERIIAT